MPGTVNVWNNINAHVSLPVADPNYIDVAIGYAYSFTVANTTGADITSGVIELWDADADPNDPCKPDTFEPMQPVAGCTPIVSGVPEEGPVTITLSPELPIPAHSSCVFSAPCPRQFVQIRGLPAGVEAWATVSSLKRTDWSHLGPLGYLPMPLAMPFSPVMMTAGQQQALPPAQQQPPQAQRRTLQPTSRPAPSPQPQRPRQPAE